ncbi:hypothetical protein QZH56_18650 [Streptomyces olivoreticuli]|uniref:hypothetical protein n=1 Tax=Streptomyces olivoreticuli TaxID=68246 RepID=UPI00265B11CB|nr:hypothetical protein [Streptomyces olivoreticuli]WKK20920.1 hypothetical protein QZH56_18650 [Streptomyces olivoreticuli]
MPVVTDLDSVPLTPVYTIVISVTGEASVDGEPVESLPGQDARTSALADIRVRAARRGHPVRINAKEPDGSVWPLIVDHDGAVTPLDAPHPVPVATPAPAVAPTALTERAGPLEPRHAAVFGRIVAAELRGDLAGAAAAAEELETVLTADLGPLHPHTLGALATRAWLSLLLRNDWSAATRLHVLTVERRHRAGATDTETRRAARNAHAAWALLRTIDPAAAETLRPELGRIAHLTA